MAITYFDTTNEYIINHFRSKPFKEGFLLTTDHGSWVFLSKQEYRLFISGKVNEDLELFNLMKEEGFILTENNVDKITDFYQTRFSFLKNGTSLHTIFATNDSQYMNKETAELTANFIFQSPSKNIVIEIKDDYLSNFDIIKYIVDYSKKSAIDKDVTFRLITNLNGMNDDILDFLIKEHFHITTFLDGPKELHEKNKVYTNSNSYDAIVGWINKIRRNYRIHLIPNITKFSLQYAKEIVDEYLKYDRSIISIMPLSIANFNKHWNDIGYNADEFIYFWKQIIDYLIKINQEKLFKEELATIFLRNILTKHGSNNKDFTSPHGSIITNLAYKPDGGIFPSDEAVNYDVFKLGEVTDKYTDVVLSPQSIALIRASINDHPVIDSNVYKPYTSICPICSYAENNNIIPKLPDFRYKIQVAILDYLFEKLIFDEDYRKIFLNWV